MFIDYSEQGQAVGTDCNLTQTHTNFIDLLLSW
jgi:hypothetical protein